MEVTMTFLKATLAVFVIAAALIAGGCSSSKESSGGKSGAPSVQSPAESPSKGEPGAAARTDTFDVKVDNTRKPAYEPSTPAGQPGNYAVQIGAYQKKDNADRVAALARDRFAVSVGTIFDSPSNLYKVLVGNFTTKDEARKFRDDMVQKYPSDYKDAWTTDIPQR
jgi:cell division septation protein DedD